MDTTQRTQSKITFRMSEAGQCPRALSAQYLGYEPEAKPDWLETAAEEGRWHEERLVQQLLAEDKNIVIKDRQLEVKLEYPTFTLLGHIDGKISSSLQPDSTRLLEIKSMSQYEFDRWMKGRFDEFPEYADQITCYMEATGLKETAYYVKNRNSGYIDRQVITERPSELQTIITKLTTVEQYIAIAELAPADCDISTLKCRRCFYKYICIKSKEDMTLQEEVMLQKAAADYRKGKELERLSKELIGSAKKIFWEHTIASGLKSWQFAGLVISNITVKEHEVPARLQKEYSYIRIDDTKEEE